MTSQVKPTNLNEAIQLHWNARYALDAAKEAERQAREWLADFMCLQEDGYKNKTLRMGDGSKIELTVQRGIRLPASSEQYRSLPSMVNKVEGFTSEKLNAFIKTKHTTELSYSGYKNLPASVKEILAPVLTTTESLAVKYVPATDNR